MKSAFDHMNGSKGYITIDDIRQFLADNGFYATERELAGLI
jgi:hypothetical protein